MGAISDYKIMYGHTHTKLAIRVNEYIKKGYTPFGNLLRDQDNIGYTGRDGYSQAVVLRTPGYKQFN